MLLERKRPRTSRTQYCMHALSQPASQHGQQGNTIWNCGKIAASSIVAAGCVEYQRWVNCRQLCHVSHIVCTANATDRPYRACDRNVIKRHLPQSLNWSTQLVSRAAKICLIAHYVRCSFKSIGRSREFAVITRAGARTIEFLIYEFMIAAIFSY